MPQLNTTSPSDTFVEVFPIIEPGYLTVYDWEVVELTSLRRWVGQNWKLSVYASVIYVILIYLGQSWMKNRPAYNLRSCLTSWNVVLALFSCVGFFRTAPELWHVMSQPHGFYISVCTRYHHVTVMVYTWSTYEDYEPSLRWFMTMNMAVHALMYTYYALRALRVKVPRRWACGVTCLQISQMIFGVFINLYTVYIKRNGHDCVRRDEVIQLALLMYVSYFILFANFFYQSYLKSSRSSPKSVVKPKDQ